MAKDLRSVLEAALRENPDDLAAHMAYGDLLSEQGDPRGEFIQVQLALEDPARPAGQRKELQNREKELLEAHIEEWLGPIHTLFGREGYGPFADEPFGMDHFHADGFSYRFSRGWLESLSLGRVNRELMPALAECPAIGLLRELEIEADEYENEGIPEMAELPFLGTLRSLRLGPETDSCHITAEDISEVVRRTPRIEELRLHAHGVDVEEVFALPMPHLRLLHVHHLHQYPLEVLAANPSLGNLVTLSCLPHGREPGDDDAYLTADGFIALVNSPHLKSLTNLHLVGTGIGDRGVTALAASGMLRRLRVLNLDQGCVTDEGARLLAASPHVRGLTRLVLSHNGLTEDGIEVLRATGVPLVAEGQYSEESIAEGEYLWYGDPE
jgi:uncharacterized protein (TIGR02996 family)